MSKLFFFAIVILSSTFSYAQNYFIGKPAPDVPLTLVEDGTIKGIRLSDYRGKVVLMDFWTTWCGGCITSMPGMGKLKKQFKNELVILPIHPSLYTNTSQFGYTDSFWRNNLYTMASNLSFVADTFYYDYFKNTGVPAHVWINQDGIVVARTQEEYYQNSEIAKKIITNKTVDLLDPMVNESWPFDFNKSLLKSDMVSGRKIENIGNRGFFKFINGVSPDNYLTKLRISEDKDNKFKRVTVLNESLKKIIVACYGKRGKKFDLKSVFINSKNTKWFNKPPGQPENEWLRGSGVSYEAVYPISTFNNAIYDSLLTDLMATFNLAVKIQEIPTDAFVLSINDEAKFSTQIADKEYKGLTDLKQVVSMLNDEIHGIPIIADTKIVSGKHFIQIINPHVYANVSSVTELNRLFSVYGLTFKKQSIVREVLVIDDSK